MEANWNPMQLFDFLQLLGATFLATPDVHEGSDNWQHFDPLMSTQEQAYCDPARMADKFQTALIPSDTEAPNSLTSSKP